MKVAPAVRVALTLLGLILVIGAFAFNLIFGMANNPPPLRIAVAVQDLPAGSSLQPENYRIVDQQIDPGLARLYVQERELADYNGALVVDTIRRGDPLNKSRLAAGDRSAALRRYALVLTDSNEVIMTLPVNPAIIPGKVSAGDRVNILFTVGRDISLSSFPDPTEAPPTETPEPTPTPEALDPSALENPVVITPEITATATPTLTPTPVVALPLADLMLEHVEVLEVVYQQIQNPNYGPGGDSRPFIDGQIIAIVVKVPRAYQTVLSFAAASGDLRFAISSPALVVERDIKPGAGVDWKTYADMYRWKVMESLGRGETLTRTLYPEYTPAALITPGAPAAAPAATPTAAPTEAPTAAPTEEVAEP